MRDTDERPLHPGAILRMHFMAPYDLAADEISDATGIPVHELSELAEERVPLTVSTALLLAAYFDTPVEDWLRMQSAVDAWDTARVMAEELSAILPVDPNRGIWAEYEPLPPGLLDELREMSADLDNPQRYVIRSKIDDGSAFASYYDVESGCWAMDLPGGTRFKRRWAAEKVIEGMNDDHYDVIEIDTSTCAEILAHRKAERQGHNFQRLTPEANHDKRT